MTVCSFGDASANHSTAVGAINASLHAAYQGLPMPLLFVCEDNGWGISVPTPNGWIEQSFAHRGGLRYACADFINPRGAPIAATYRRGFVAGKRLTEPRLAVAVRAVVAATEEEAQHLSASWRMAFDLLRRGRLIAVPPPEKAQRYLELHAEEREGSGNDRLRLTGTPAQVRAEIEEIAAAYGAEEAIVVTITHDHEDRRRSYQLLAEEFGLDERR